MSTTALKVYAFRRLQVTMGLIDQIFSPQISSIQKSMDLATQRQKLLTNNLANVNVPGYKRQDMDFNLALDQSLNPSQNSGLDITDPTSQDSQTSLNDFSQFQSQFANQSSLREDGNNVDLETEVSSIAETNARYQALSVVATNYFQNIKSVLT